MVQDLNFVGTCKGGEGGGGLSQTSSCMATEAVDMTKYTRVVFYIKPLGFFRILQATDR